MRARSCLGGLVLTVFLGAVFAGSSYFWFRFFVRGKSVATPELVGKSLSEARAVTLDSGLLLQLDNTRDRHADQVPVGAIAWQNRAPGTSVKRGTQLYVGLSLGPLILTVPDLTGESSRTAMLRFSQRNLRLGNVAFAPGLGKPGIIAEDPPPGTVVAGQTQVSVLVVPEPDPPRFVMPDVIDLPLEFVRSALDMRRLTVTNVKYETYPGIADGLVIRQFPLRGHPVSSRDAITLVVSRNEESMIMEDVR